MLLSCVAVVYRQSAMSPLELMGYVGLLGAGVGPLYSQTIMSLEEIMPIDKRSAGILYVYHTFGFIVIPWGLGQVADERPYLLFGLCAVAATLLIIIFGVLATLQNVIRKRLAKQ